MIADAAARTGACAPQHPPPPGPDDSYPPAGVMGLTPSKYGGTPAHVRPCDCVNRARCHRCATDGLSPPLQAASIRPGSERRGITEKIDGALPGALSRPPCDAVGLPFGQHVSLVVRWHPIRLGKGTLRAPSTIMPGAFRTSSCLVYDGANVHTTVSVPAVT
jgi:hypothetical protein